MIHKSGITLTALEDWRIHAGPKIGIHWQDDRSAKESARAWLGAAPSVPFEIGETLASHSDFGRLERWTAEPEARVRFDSFRGEPANLDVLLEGADARGPIIMAVEAKADETFGQTVQGAWSSAEARLTRYPNSKGIARLEQLLRAICGVEVDALGDVEHLRYQLLTGTAALLSAGPEDDSTRRVFMIHEFVTDRTEDARHTSNAADLDAYVRFLSGEPDAAVTSGQLVGPLSVPGQPLWSSAPTFWVGKAVRSLRGWEENAWI